MLSRVHSDFLERKQEAGRLFCFLFYVIFENGTMRRGEGELFDFVVFVCVCLFLI